MLDNFNYLIVQVWAGVFDEFGWKPIGFGFTAFLRNPINMCYTEFGSFASDHTTKAEVAITHEPVFERKKRSWR